MKLVVLERNSAGTDIDVSCFEKFGEVVYHPNTVADNTAERVKDADIIIANKRDHFKRRSKRETDMSAGNRI